jgi:hypothetical protein
MIVPTEAAGYTGWTYMLMWPLGRLNGWMTGKQMKRLGKAAPIAASI